MNLTEYHKKKNDLFADIFIFFNKEPESFYMFPDELIERLREFSKDTAHMIKLTKLINCEDRND